MSVLRRRPPPASATPDADDLDLTLGGHPVGDGSFTAIALDYPVTPRARWGHGRPSHPGLTELLAAGRDRYRTRLEGILELRDALGRIHADESGGSAEPHWVNGWLPGLDAAALYSVVTHGNPKTYLEVGSGNSTKFARRAITDHGLRTRLVSIDPFPRAEVDALCDEVIREAAEGVDLALYDRLESGDVLFVDNSHRALQNSDVVAMFLDVLPRLRPGVLVEFHDICLPDDYPPAWFDRFYSEQYVLAAFLLAPGSQMHVELPCYYVSDDPELSRVLDPLWDLPHLGAVERHGGSFWIVTV